MVLSRAWGAFAQVVGAFLLGFGTIFQPKATPTDHWSTSPRVTIVAESPRSDAGDSLGREDGFPGPCVASP